MVNLKKKKRITVPKCINIESTDFLKCLCIHLFAQEQHGLWISSDFPSEAKLDEFQENEKTW